ncbi:hypothetical protein NQ317_012485 [Molorchus minor]|uniref:Proteasome inhibitor PI31 subunit n=1 Tax=Molorchus minor TaxID=1323400 RepID=A0ABQ9K352_9CUCU|nr:hypothetical protein NQ317_012485 [Molorchus minor]
MASSLFGWDLLYSSVEKDIRNNQDILVCLTHLVLVSNGFKCIGLGESKTIDGSETKVRLFPKHKKTGTLEEMIPDCKSMVDTIKKQLIDKVVVSTKSREVSIQTESARESREPRSTLLEDPISGMVPPRIPIGIPAHSIIDPLSPLSNVGRSDLDPFGGLDPLRVPNRIIPPGGGGMIFQPPPPQLPPGNLGIPPGSLPPGARFDPFRPPDANRFPPRRTRPDNDELPPPGYDDMFM